MSADPLLETAAAVRDHHQPNEWDSCVACNKQWPCDAELLAELVVTRAALAAPVEADAGLFEAAWASLRNGLSKSYTARDIDAALATARPRIEAALSRPSGSIGEDHE